MEIIPIRNEADYEAALQEIEALFEAEFGSPAGDRLDILVTRVEAYEEKNHPVPPPDPIEAILFTMENRALSRKELEPYLGSRARVSEVLNRKRPLTLNMSRRLQEGLNIPAEILIRPYPLAV